MDLDSMKYAELRSIAKELGLKANMKAEKLLKAIKQHYEEGNDKKEEGQGQDNDVPVVQEEETVTQGSAEEKTEVSSPAVFVNTRRGKGNGTKRKICDTAAEGDTEVEASGPPGSASKTKKRKMSSAKDKGESEPAEEPQVSSSEQQQQLDMKDEAPVLSDPGKAPKQAKPGKIPRYQKLQQKNKPQLKPVTPNFKKLHEAHFNKMESIDSYVQRKTKQMETFRSSVKELKKLSDKTKLQQVDGKTQVKANPSRASLFSPIRAEDRRTLLLASKAHPKKPAGDKDALFKPSVLSTRRINVRFSEATQDNEQKKSLVKTPSRMSFCVTSSTPQQQATDGGKARNVKTFSATKTLSATKTPGAFVFTGNTSTSTTPGTQKKPSFDLKASLSRPLSYKPHTGKLKPFGDAKENAAGNTSLNPHQQNYKQHQVKTRGDRRAKQVEDRKQKKESMLGARRGLVMM